MTHKAPGKFHRKGLTLVELFQHVPRRCDGGVLVCRTALAGRAALPLLRLDQRPVGRQAQDYALPLPRKRVRQTLQRPHQDAHGIVEARLSGLGGRALPSHDQSQRRVEHEAPPRP